ncbi:hypothetical protein Bca52824_039482 [Brassica carinata]|uniref:Replication protein A 70 kDa DNA-binding subunit B/D first OB fold domain-containing protein n=1 Tax=Brassica carinata TaxID=52824 RepID=A0A8X7RRQ3_BRACI|nr:hypothetical protein Bca52824_039482 [Brassica carinata]
MSSKQKMGCKIHAACKKNYLKTLGEECKVGEWKKLYNFQVSAAGKHYRPTQHMYKITFINQTVIKPSDFQNDDMFLSLAEFDSVMSGKLDNDILIDIVGQAIEISEIQTIKCTSEDGKHIVTQANSGTGQKLSNWKEFEDKKLSELLGCTQVEKCKVVATIYAIDTDYAWYYFGPEAKFVLLDWIAWPVIGVKAEKILNGSLDEVEDPELLPECITDLVGKTYKFDVTIEKGAEIFKVLKVWSVYNTLMVDSQSETALERETIAISGSEVSLLTYSDESSSKMTTPSKRTVDDIVDIPYNTSTSKICHVKSIKVEKMTSEELSLKKN